MTCTRDIREDKLRDSIIFKINLNVLNCGQKLNVYCIAIQKRDYYVITNHFHLVVRLPVERVSGADAAHTWLACDWSEIPNGDLAR